jgi:1,4-dihydroxy-2-naphthoyl-CoA hydrolase
MMIWFKNYSVAEVAKRNHETLSHHLGIEILEVGPDFITAKMPVDQRTKQPIGLLHGGASVVLAETLASNAANMVVDHTKQFCVGLEINANHVRSARDGFVIGKTTPIHIGKSTQLWETKIYQDEKLICISRMTAAVLDRK